MYVHRWAFIRLLYRVCPIVCIAITKNPPSLLKTSCYSWTGFTGCNQVVQAIENLPIAYNNNITSKQTQLTTSYNEEIIMGV